MLTKGTTVSMKDGGSGTYISSGALMADGTKFCQAYNELEKAKTIISTIRREFNNLSNVKPGNLKNAINTLNCCKMEDLVNYVIKVRESLKQNDAQFKKDYNAEFEKHKDALLQLNDGEYAFIANKETEYSILSELEEMAAKGQLTDEGLKILEIQRLRVANIEIQEKIAVTPITDPQYDKYVKEYFDNLKKQIDLDTKLTDTEKIQAKEKITYEYNYSSTNTDYMREIKKLMEELNSFTAGSTKYYEKCIEINNAQVEMYEFQLEAYYKAKPESEFTDADRQNIKQLKSAIEQAKEANEKYKLYAQGYTDDMIEYENMSWWEKRWEDTKTIGCTIYTSVAGVGESIIDGTIMLTAGTAGWVGNQFGATGLSTWVEDFVATDYAKKQYDLFVDNGTLNSVSAYSSVHGVTDFIVTTGTYACISFIPGVGGSAVMAAGGGGSTAETAFENGATFNETYGATLINSALAFAADFGLDKLNSSGAMSSMNVWGKVGVRTAIGVGEPALNMISEYALYGHENSDNLFDYGVDSGGFLNMLIGGTVANVSGLTQDYMRHKAEVDFQKKTEINTDLDNMTPEQRSKAWEDYYNQKYGNKSDVEHMSGNNIDGSNGSFVDPNATYTNSAMEDFIDIVDPTNKTSGLDIANRNGKFIEELTTYKDIEIEDLYQQLLQQGLIDENVLPLSTAKGIFKGSGSTIIDGQELKITNETAIKKTMLEVLATGSGNGKTSSELFAEFGLTYNDPQPGSLTALQSRVWYLENEKLIKVKKDAFVELNPQATLREQAEFCVNERNRLRKVTREAMQDAEMRDYLNAAEQKTLDDLVNNKRQKLAKTKGVELHEITDDEVYKAIINSSDQSRTPLNDLLGIGRNN